mmetsp:Transcript_59019/g.191108  ORF Transcript_59019/g.191108 Transcript_59019/m.191108 type:complete len:364 (+) Transcript_59019:90-1181(+)
MASTNGQPQPMLALGAPPRAASGRGGDSGGGGPPQPMLALGAPPPHAALADGAAAAHAAAGTTAAAGQGGAASAAAAGPQQPLLALGATPWPGVAAREEVLKPCGQQPGNRSSTSTSWQVFAPSYEWAAVPEEASVPPGLEMNLSMDGSGSRSARIPPSWRMLVVSEPGNDACRFDVARWSTLAAVRAEVAKAMADGDLSRVRALLADGVAIAGEGTPESCWARTVEHAQLFGRRITASIISPAGAGAPPPAAPCAGGEGGQEADAEVEAFEVLSAQLGTLGAAVAEVEKALGASGITVGHARSELAQLEAELERLQCRGIDVLPASSEAARQRRRELTRRVELLSTRMGGLFVGLGAAVRQR